MKYMQIQPSQPTVAKWDYINDSIHYALRENEHFIVIPLDRGIFAPIMIFDVANKFLYTIMKSKNFEKLLNRDYIEKPHYIDAMLDCNLHFQEEPRQIAFDGFGSDYAENQIQTIKNDIFRFLQTDTVLKYVTIVIDFNGYTLNDVEAVTCSKFLDVLFRESWNEYIVTSYEDIVPENNTAVNQEYDISQKIKIKKPSLAVSLKQESDVG